MLDGKKVLGIIPARGGSKRLPRKNLLHLAGRPLITYTIEAGLRSHFIDELMVSTDDQKIADIATSSGARVPFIRPASLARDETGYFEVIKHAIEYYIKTEGKKFDYIVYLQPTSPLRDYTEIDNAMALMQRKNADAVISVSEPDHTPLWCNTLPDNLSMEGFLSDDVKYKRSQELDRYYRLNGALYIVCISRLLTEKTFFINNNIFAYIMPQEKSIDIDTALDLKLCEVLMQERICAKS
jgi:CMP-N,N'-diacetyllegionaminic acid synthase